jgi:hypothetical protein
MVEGTSAPETRTTGAGSRAGHGIVEALRIFLIFVLIGPLIGTIVIAVLLVIVNIWTGGISGPPGPFGALGIIIFGPVTGWSYIMGGIPAAIAGLIVAIKGVYFGGASGRFALGTGVSVGIALGTFTVVVMHDAGYFALTLGATLMLSTLACWRLVKHWFKVPA